MDDREQVIKHLEIIQSVINRLAHDSFLIKGWSMTILVAAVVLLSRSEGPSGWVVLCLLMPVVGFGILDGYFLWQERLFRRIYDRVRMQDKTDFAMKDAEKGKEPRSGWIYACCSWPRSGWICACCSCTLLFFYGLEAFLVIAVAVFLFCG